MHSRWWNRLLLLIIIGMTAFSIITVWPSEPDRYLPNAIPWPVGRGIKLKLPTIKGGTFKMSTVERRAMSLGLDLRGGARIVLAPEEGQQIDDLDAALDGARKVIERRVNQFGVAESEVNRLGKDRLQVLLPGIDPEQAKAKISTTGLLQFCEPVTNQGGEVAVVQTGTVRYKPQTCEPVRDEAGNIVVDGGGTIEYRAWAASGSNQAANNPSTDIIVWKPAAAEINGQVKELNGRYLRPNTFVRFTSVLNEPELQFEWTSDGEGISKQVTERMITRNYPLAPFLDGQPIRDSNNLPIAPRVNGVITSAGVISGLSQSEAQELSTLLNTGAFPLVLKTILENQVDAALGDAAVRDSVIAGEVAILMIMVFMVLYYRLPGLMASAALVVYTSAVLAVFKLWPVTLTLSGVAAFVLSLGMAVDANILIFERMKEELRVGRNLVVALEDGFNRAWSSIRDSNISTLMTCAILYWFGNQFGEAAIKGFAITLAIGVLISLFSAITVTRTFMRLLIGFRPLARHLWLFVPDLPAEVQLGGRRPRPVVAGGAGGTPPRREEGR